MLPIVCVVLRLFAQPRQRPGHLHALPFLQVAAATSSPGFLPASRSPILRQVCRNTLANADS